MRLLATPATAESARGSAELRADLLAALEAEILPGRYIPTSGSEGSKKIVGLVEQLERSKAPPRFPADLAMVDGSWDLLFTTNAVSIDQNLLNSLGALPATPLSPLLDGSPLRTRRVRQEIDVAANRVRNCVTITAWPEGGGELFPPVLKELLAGLEGSDLCLTLDHLAVVENALSPASAQYMPARLRIELQQVRRILEPGPIPASSVGAGLLDLVPKEVRAKCSAPGSARIACLAPKCWGTTHVAHASPADAFRSRVLREPCRRLSTSPGRSAPSALGALTRPMSMRACASAEASRRGKSCASSGEAPRLPPLSAKGASSNSKP